MVQLSTPLGWPLTGEWAPREALFVQLLWPLVITQPESWYSFYCLTDSLLSQTVEGGVDLVGWLHTETVTHTGTPLCPYRVCIGRLECTPTSLLHDSSRCMPSNEAGRSSEGAPSQWPALTYESIPAIIRTVDSHPAFHPVLKTHLFRSAFDNYFLH